MEYTAEGRRENALQRVIFIIDYNLDFAAKDFELFDSKYKEWRSKLPRRTVNNAFMVRPNSQAAVINPNQVVGLSYESLLNDGEVEFGLRFETNRVLFISGSYTRWSEIWPKAEDFLQQAVSMVPEENQIVSFSVEYSDIFRAKGDYNDFNAEELLRVGSDYIPPHVFNRNLNFHFHTGFFELVEEPANHRVLTRINADLKDNSEEEARDLLITLFHSVLPVFEPYNQHQPMLDEKVLSKGLQNFVQLHKLDKKLLSQILSEKMARKIGLKNVE